MTIDQGRESSGILGFVRSSTAVFAILFALGYFLFGTAWAWSSAIGSSPDDDYHLASAWCPPPLDSSGCTIGFDPSTGRRTVEVPAELTVASCYRFESDQSAACQASAVPGTLASTYRVDDGDYPGPYYRFLHLFVGPDIDHSVLVMRTVNVAIAALVYGAALMLVPDRQRRIVVTTVVATIVPTTISFVASINPSSWAITGVVGLWFACMALLGGMPRNRPAAITLLVVSAALAATSRADAAAYVCVVTLAAAVLYLPTIRRSWRLLIPMGLAAAAGFWTFFSSGQNDALAGITPPSTDLDGFSLFARNLMDLPGLLLGTFGVNYSLGWFDTALPAVGAFGGMLAVLVVMVVGLGQMWRRKALAALIVLGVAATLPMFVLQVNRVRIPADVQPRYVLPLIIVLVAVLAIGQTEFDATRLSAAQAWIVWGLVNVTNVVSLHVQINRYTTGLDSQAINPGANAEWWWETGPSPMTVWLFGSAILAAWSYFVVVVNRPPVEVPIESLPIVTEPPPHVTPQSDPFPDPTGTETEENT